ncbi:zinc-binding metallopeptidase family protein [Alkalilimnicola ehrlichii MLHE-1]|uniref:Zinc-ribbon domain-containing protein n=1 Tax=Alkalilimnicola ehrlichii (strain ATCC BAA-1101 / DSM 17681 / MLHE-1) TaxID=187272 RepID=Q0AAL0_ALKEH|nr:putative zinc-binding peptidase [Alkalilimnicola ehrlichii]ABI56127.1 conserved hypothetical protein [Alkalilimnicola ehrlichii MLHE-1]
MRRFQCQCGNHLYFDNTYCLNCHHQLGFLPDRLTVSALRQDRDGLWTALNPEAGQRRYRQCAHYEHSGVCNWMVPAEDPNPHCLACRLNHVIPDLSVPVNWQRWGKLEAAKRRLIYQLLHIGLPIHGRTPRDPSGLAFAFLADPIEGQSVSTGHTNGLITINIGEADPVRREAVREKLGEPYRTLLGHFRHESGHYFWERFFADTGRQPTFRAVFGDERQDYGQALRQHYNQPNRYWQEQHISRYASSHPWEDWAETWAHYLHMRDALETAEGLGLVLEDEGKAVSFADRDDFQYLLNAWVKLTMAMNSMSRSMGSPDMYPFTITPTVAEKLEAVHREVHAVVTGERRPPGG